MYCIYRCLGWSGTAIGDNENSLLDQPKVVLDTSRMGSDAVIVKNGLRICGTGAALANTAIVQDKAYFEVKLQSTGIWGIGLAVGNIDVNKVPLGEDVYSWVLRHDGHLCHNKITIHDTKYKPAEGDVVGVSYDHVEMNCYVNGKSLNFPIPGIKGTVFPVLYVDESAILDVQFTDLSHQPSGYSQIMVDRQIF
ncbi:unnamed protein product [Clavelina lepadiformis]|uniref:SPRY domain-containing protein 7 n=1 Tax=Clavelina lepadiformis TaxID=159417 RepID=A0ABP0FEU5_CLALP